MVISVRTLENVVPKMSSDQKENHTNLEELATFLQTEMGRCKDIDRLHLHAVKRGNVVSQNTIRQ